MGKPEDNLCRLALLEGQKKCNKEDLLTECINMCKNLQVKCVSHGDTTVEEKLAIKKVIYKENDNEIRAALKE